MTAEPIDRNWSMGERIMLARRRAELEQQDVALALDISRALVSRWERDLSIPRADKLEAFALLTGFPLMFFYGDDDLKGGAEITPRIPDQSSESHRVTLGVVGQQQFTFSPPREPVPVGHSRPLSHAS